jgi:hypothetical protein
VVFIFGPVDAGVDVDGELAEGTVTNADFRVADCVSAIGRPVNNIASLSFAARGGLIYANVHSLAHTAGEVRGQLLEKTREEVSAGNACRPLAMLALPQRARGDAASGDRATGPGAPLSVLREGWRGGQRGRRRTGYTTPLILAAEGSAWGALEGHTSRRSPCESP